jgi:hypothetical protein
MIGKLVTRNTKIEAPDGMKTILVFGVITVPIDSPAGGNGFANVDNNMAIDLSTLNPLPSKFAAWDASDVCEELFGLNSMREANEMAYADEGLALIRDGKYDNPRLGVIVEKLKRFIEDMPVFDMMKQVFESIVKTAEKNAPKA